NYQIEKLKAIQRNINRIDRIVYGLLNFSHPSRFNFDYHNVNEILERLEKLEPILKHFLPENIKIIRKYDSKLPQGWFDSDCLEQVFLNLISNATRAMKYGGELYITTSFDSTRKGIIIKFEDTGVGIPEGNLKKIFKPFFTTYEEGTGLGLSICQNIIKEHKGNISVESKLGKGTIFTIFLPLEKRKEKKQVVDGI
ncbi:MAG: GHKL domain-containing protein, partial [Chloroflexi bacterium]|nr:GHKL domain-containing protein [Chloroflexota bacterium]